MIQKIEKILSVGKFRDFTAKGDISFNNFTVLYAENGAGKTTIASILRSLKLGDKNLIHKRISTKSKANQVIQIIERESTGTKKNYSFGINGWNNIIDSIEVFDTFFVNENIYSGLLVSDEHRKNLHHFIVGSQGIAIKNKILKNKQDREQNRGEIERLTQKIIREVGLNLTENDIRNFIKIEATEAVDIDVKINKAKVHLKNARERQSIRRYHELPSLGRWTTQIDFISLLKDVQSSTSTIQDKSLERLFQEHMEILATNEVDNPEDWARIGFNYVLKCKQISGGKKESEVKCPFCKQEVSLNSDIIKAYAQVFNDEFNDYLIRLNEHLKIITEFNLEVLFNKKYSFKEIFDERLNFWKEYITEEAPKFNVISKGDATKLRDAFSKLKSIIEEKTKNPSKVCITDAILEFQHIFNQINVNINGLNQQIDNYNSCIRMFKRGLEDPASVEERLRILQRTKKRFEKEIDELCRNYIKIAKRNKLLEEEYSRLSKEETAAANRFISTYASKINYYLSDVFDTPFQIKNMQHGIRKGKGKDVKIEYELLLDGNPISFEQDEKFSICECLSEGDKSTIALSFFLSKLEIDPMLSNKILVFDDPLSSLDANRRHTTVNLILEIHENLNQVIVLSHNERFLWELYNNCDKSSRKALRISQDHYNDNSIIEPLDIEYLNDNQYFIHITEMEDWLKNPDVRKKEQILGLIRNVLESHIKFKFYRQLKHINPNRQTFGTCIDELENSGVPFRENNDRKNIIRLLRVLNGISCKPHHGEAIPDYEKLGVNPSKITDTELALFVKKTFKLIDEKL